MIFSKSVLKNDPLREKLDAIYRQDEETCINELLNQTHFNVSQQNNIEKLTSELVLAMRERMREATGIDSLMHRYGLSSEQGIALMCLAEALLRIPDSETVDALIKDKLFSANWETELNQTSSLFVNAAVWGLVLTGKLYKADQEKSLLSVLKQWLQKAGEPIVRKAVKEAIKILGKQFVLGETIEEALKRTTEKEFAHYRFSFDMLGEAARTEEDALRYLNSYKKAIDKIGAEADEKGPILSNGISVKLSALYPRYEIAKREILLPVVVDRLTELAMLAKKYNIGLTVDAEEADKLDLSLDIIAAVFKNPAFKTWEGFGLAVQAYQKRAFYLIDWLAELAESENKKLMIRLVKGAYWDFEIKDSQVKGLDGYPVFTRKITTDASYLACAKKIIDKKQHFYPQFATHNAHTVAAIMTLMGNDKNFEFQRLKGMGRELYEDIIQPDKFNIPCRIYAPVGEYRDLLAYLVRRLLENGANSSFVNRISHLSLSVSELVSDPFAQLKELKTKVNPHIPLPKEIYVSWMNSKGIDLSNMTLLEKLSKELNHFSTHTWKHHHLQGEVKIIHNPANHSDIVGEVKQASHADIEKMLEKAEKAAKSWNNVYVAQRAAFLESAADYLEQHQTELMALIVREAGRSIPDAIAEVREAADFCRYYAYQARKTLAPHTLPGPTGESNTLQLHGRGTIVCISPWNFPLAIFTGQIMAAVVAGNAVIAKPADQTPLIALRAIQLFHAAGIPADVLQCAPGSGRTIGAQLVSDSRVKGVMFTGSTETARSINQTLAMREGPIVPFIAETGGQNAMIADSTALAEQLVQDVISSAFGSAGQRCSALRVLFLQEETADHVIKMLQGAMAELSVGDPSLLATDVGPVIDDKAREGLENHIHYLNQIGKLIYRVPTPAFLPNGSFFAPCAYEIESITQLKREVFGPVLHVVRYPRKQLERIIDEINQTGYGLTLGIQTRISATATFIQERIRAGNAYVNRNMIGAVVGVQPFGGEGLSGTGPKAGGPHYLARLCHERTLTINTTAAGGNASLLALAS